METAPRRSRVVKFGVFEVDLQAGELRKSGIRQKLVGQPFQVLQILLEHPQEVVTREELRQRIWSNHTFIDHDLALKKAVNRIRDVLGDSAESPRFIETLPRRVSVHPTGHRSRWNDERNRRRRERGRTTK
jgi:DNA-binding winged helix-turn-helix (wHTH) protein